MERLFRTARIADLLQKANDVPRRPGEIVLTYTTTVYEPRKDEIGTNRVRRETRTRSSSDTAYIAHGGT